MPPALAKQRGLLLRLLAAVESDERFRALELQCSLARGAADELSDVDAGLWADDGAWDEALAAVPALIRDLGASVDVFEQTDHETPYFFAQYVDGSQLDLLVQRASRAKGRVPQAVLLLDRDGLLAQPWEPRSLQAGVAERREWAFFAWLALANLAKYLHRGSLWEARAQLEEARTQLLRLHAAHLGIAYPGFGLASILDAEAPLPAKLDATLAALNETELRRAASALADILEEHEPPPLAAFVRARLR